MEYLVIIVSTIMVMFLRAVTKMFSLHHPPLTPILHHLPLLFLTVVNSLLMDVSVYLMMLAPPFGLVTFLNAISLLERHVHVFIPTVNMLLMVVLVLLILLPRSLLSLSQLLRAHTVMALLLMVVSAFRERMVVIISGIVPVNAPNLMERPVCIVSTVSNRMLMRVVPLFSLLLLHLQFRPALVMLLTLKDASASRLK
jgi:hypothetical protein